LPLVLMAAVTVAATVAMIVMLPLSLLQPVSPPSPGTAFEQSDDAILGRFWVDHGAIVSDPGSSAIMT
jgi:hypothetical protein